MRYRGLPFYLFVGFTAFSIATLFFGPIGYKGLRVGLLLTFIVPFVTFLGAGFWFGSRGFASPQSLNVPIRGQAIVWPLILIACASSTYAWLEPTLAGQTISLDAIGESYVEGYRGYVRGSATIDAAYVAEIFEQAVVTLALVTGVAHFRRLSRGLQVATAFILVSYVLTNVLFTGKQKYLGDAVIYVTAAVGVGLAARSARVRFRFIVGALVSGLITAGLFAEMLRQRYLAAGIGLGNVSEKIHPLVSWDLHSVLFRVLGLEYGFASAFFLSYFSNGLYGLYLSLTLPFEWSYFAGNSYALSRVAEIAIDAPASILSRTYPFRVGEAYGWEFDKWHSALSWLASDFSFPGLLALAPIAGWVYGRVWKQAVAQSNAFAAPLFAYLSLGLAFIYSNNQMVHSLGGAIALTVLFFGWLLSDLGGSRPGVVEP